MLIKLNNDAVAKVMASDLRGDPMNVRKPLYIEQNIFGVHPDTPIIRVVKLRHLLNDIKSGTLYHSKIGQESWGDPSENPLSTRTFVDDVTGGTLSISADDLYGVCWSLEPAPTKYMWDYFSYGEKSVVCIQSTPRKLLQGAMNLNNPFFMLQHYIGKVQYLTEDLYEEYFSDPDWSKHLDSLGQGLVLSTMRLLDDLDVEKEVRLIFRFARDEPWVRSNVEVGQLSMSIPFDWPGVLDAVVAGPNLKAESCADIQSKLHELGIDCPVAHAHDLMA